jgi:DNA polymerase-4
MHEDPALMNTIIHLDMDAFYASIEQRDQPRLRGRPVIVGGHKEKRGVVAACSYEARAFGVHSAMPSGQAERLCPKAVFLPVRMEHYRDISCELMTILGDYTPIIEQLSIDEAFLDLNGTRYLWPDTVELARNIKQVIREKLSLTASIGLARNKFLAKVASDMDKPDGLTVVPEARGEMLRFLAPLPVKRIWGVGKVLDQNLAQAGIRTIGDIQAMTKYALVKVPGNAMGERLWDLAHGVDDRELELDRIEKSISSETTFARDILGREILERVLIQQAEDVGWRLRHADKFAGTVQLKLRFADFKTITRQVSMHPRIQSDQDLIQAAGDLLEKVQLGQGVRLLGVGVSKLYAERMENQAEQLDLFGVDPLRAAEEHEKLDRAVDSVREKYGKGALKRGLSSD